MKAVFRVLSIVIGILSLFLLVWFWTHNEKDLSFFALILASLSMFCLHLSKTS